MASLAMRKVKPEEVPPPPTEEHVRLFATLDNDVVFKEQDGTIRYVSMPRWFGAVWVFQTIVLAYVFGNALGLW